MIEESLMRWVRSSPGHEVEGWWDLRERCAKCGEPIRLDSRHPLLCGHCLAPPESGAYGLYQILPPRPLEPAAFDFKANLAAAFDLYASGVRVVENP